MTAGDARFRGTKRFQVLRRLGSGGAGVVYEVYDREQNARFALKTLQALHPNALLRFKAEFRALQDLRHPNLVRLGELFEEDEWWFFTMEYVDGVDLLEYVRHQTSGREEAAEQTVQTTTRAMAASPAGDGAAPRDDGFDEAKLRSGLAQLSRALLVLHAAGKVHRDVKPSNVLVDRLASRVVVLDFGLVLDLQPGGHELHLTQADEVVGTVGYMAPEQAAARAVGPPADWYSVGVILYRALTGRLPFRGPSHEVLADKRAFEPPPPRSVVTGIPADLDALCMELLRIEPSRRPTGIDILRRLSANAAPEVTMPSIPPPRAPPFIGRDHELAVLHDAFQATREGHAVTVCIVGESGLGKTALARRFGERLASEYGAIVLTGRCHERESVRFKGVDGVIDALARHLVTLPKADAAALLPRRAALLPQAFPVLKRVEVIADAPMPLHDVLDPKELRDQIFAAVRELLARLAERRPLVVVIDDLHWSDADSLALLRDVMRQPDAPPLLLLTTAREGGSVDPWSLAEDAQLLPLLPLSPEHSRELASTLLSRADSPSSADAATIAAEAAGHPFFIDELVRHNLSIGVTETGPTSRRLVLDEALWSRVERLEQSARDVVELVSIADAPLPQSAIALAADVEFSDLAPRVWALRIDNLVRISGVRRHDSIEPYHDRVRSSVLAHMSEKTRRHWHERIARVLEKMLEGTGVADCTALALHWKSAGDDVRAAKYAAVAAAQAEGSLAFDRAAALYRMVLELDASPSPDHLRAVLGKLGDALVYAGRGAEAAEAFLRAAAVSPAIEARDLRRRAAEQQLISGHIDQGLLTLNEVLTELGMKLPRSPRSAFASLVLRRTQIRLRGLSFRERREDEIAPEVLQKIDLCWAAASALGMVDTIRGADFQTRHLLLALDAGEPFRVMRALTLEAVFSASAGRKNRDRTRSLVEMAEALGARLDHPLAPVYTHCEGLTAVLEGRWKIGAQKGEIALELLRERGRGVTYERDSITLYMLACLLYLGEIAELRRRLPRLQSEAKERGDLYASTNLRTGLMTVTRLVVDDVDGARRDAVDAIAEWSHAGTHVPHFLDTQAMAQVDMYIGEPARALELVRKRWKALDDAMLLRVQYIRISMLNLWVRSALMEATRGTLDRALLDEATKKARALEKEDMPWSLAFATAARAGIADAQGDDAEAIRLLVEAEQRFAEADMALHRTAARRQRGLLIGGDQGAALVQEADAAMRAQDVVQPGLLAALSVPLGRWRHR